MALADLFGGWKESYNLLKPLLRAIQITNPGTKYVVKSEHIDGARRLFKRAAWAFGPCIQGFQYVHPVVTVDAASLSGRYKGRLITCCAFDAENQLFPLAFGLVEKEDNDNWGWFMQWLRTEVIGNNRPICVVSDRHASIKRVFTHPHYGWSEDKGEGIHRLCAQHISENIVKNCGDGVWVDIFKRMAKQTKKHQFDACWDAIDKLKPEVIKYLREETSMRKSIISSLMLGMVLASSVEDSGISSITTGRLRSRSMLSNAYP